MADARCCRPLRQSTGLRCCRRSKATDRRCCHQPTASGRRCCRHWGETRCAGLASPPLPPHPQSPPPPAASAAPTRRLRITGGGGGAGGAPPIDEPPVARVSRALNHSSLASASESPERRRESGEARDTRRPDGARAEPPPVQAARPEVAAAGDPDFVRAVDPLARDALEAAAPSLLPLSLSLLCTSCTARRAPTLRGAV
eukprot:354192-Chlamydomonas_euryale.AAC.8